MQCSQYFGILHLNLPYQASDIILHITFYEKKKHSAAFYQLPFVLPVFCFLRIDMAYSFKCGILSVRKGGSTNDDSTTEESKMEYPKTYSGFHYMPAYVCAAGYSSLSHRADTDVTAFWLKKIVTPPAFCWFCNDFFVLLSVNF